MTALAVFLGEWRLFLPPDESLKPAQLRPMENMDRLRKLFHIR